MNQTNKLIYIYMYIYVYIYTYMYLFIFRFHSIHRAIDDIESNTDEGGQQAPRFSKHVKGAAGALRIQGVFAKALYTRRLGERRTLRC